MAAIGCFQKVEHGAMLLTQERTTVSMRSTKRLPRLLYGPKLALRQGTACRS